MTSPGEDELSQVRDHFHVGCYSRALQLAKSATSTNELVGVERSCIVARAELALQKTSQEERAAFIYSSNPGIKALGHYLGYYQAVTDLDRREAIDALKRLAANSQDPTAKALAASVLLETEDHNDGLRHAEGETLEMMALRLQLLISINRYDLAQELLTEMTTSNDDSAVTKLASAWMHVVDGNYQEAYLTFGDLQTLYAQGDHLEGANNSSILLNGMAVANMQRQLWAEAIEDLNRSASLPGGDNDVDTLSNLIVCYRNTQKDELADACYEKLAKLCPKHRLVSAAAQLDLALERYDKSLK